MRTKCPPPHATRGTGILPWNADCSKAMLHIWFAMFEMKRRYDSKSSRFHQSEASGTRVDKARRLKNHRVPQASGSLRLLSVAMQTKDEAAHARRNRNCSAECSSVCMRCMTAPTHPQANKRVWVKKLVHVRSHRVSSELDF